MAGRSRTVRVAACQVLTGPDPAAAAKTVVEWLKRAAEEKVRLVAFPEGCLYGCIQDEKFWRRLKPAHLADAEAKISRACRRLKIAAVVGSAHRQGTRWFSSLAIFDQKGGLVGRYSKVFLAGDKFCELAPNCRFAEFRAFSAAFLSVATSAIPNLSGCR